MELESEQLHVGKGDEGAALLLRGRGAGHAQSHAVGPRSPAPWG